MTIKLETDLAERELDRSRDLWRTDMRLVRETRGFDSLEVSARLLESASLQRQCIRHYKRKLAEIEEKTRVEARVMAVRGLDIVERADGQMTLFCTL